MKKIKTLSSVYVYQSPRLKVRHDTVRFPNGTQGNYDVVEKPDAVGVIPIFRNQFYLVEQYRYPTGQRSLEIPQGRIEKGEEPHIAAHRELLEETGLDAKSIKKIGFFWLANGHHTQGYHVFTATDCVQKSVNRESSESDMMVKTYTFDQVKELMRRGVIKDGPTLSSFCQYFLSIAL